MQVLGWRAFLPDGTSLTHEDTRPEHLDVIVGVVQYYDRCTDCGVTYRDIIQNGDWYCFDGAWFAIPTHPVPGRWVSRSDAEAMYPSAILVQSAPMLDDATWEAIQRLMMDARTL